MRASLRNTGRLALSAMALSGLALRASTAPAAAVTRARATVGTSVGAGRNAEGDVFITGPAALIRKLCPDTVRIGFVCLFSGIDETGEGIAVYRGDNRPPSQCDDVPVSFLVVNVENETNKPIAVGDGTCALKGPVRDADIEPGVDENIQGTDIWITG